MMLASIKELFVKIISLLKDIKHEQHENNERYIKNGVGHIGVPNVERKSNPFKGKGVIASGNPYVIPPRVRIEFNDINRVPEVYINGVNVADFKHNNSGLVQLDVDWSTDDEYKQSKRFYLEYVDGHGKHTIIDRGDGDICLK
ncbi:MAG TPA: hypothetical protein K8V00_03205 [Ligilactobacillus acidipiscis]|uniref:Uncharacterized protein n=1 Tax=Ligilactobacillus acidipiscis TaxID=89059 RepID=A0A921K0J9_9LACO|nr:hypothetical protein [Ligilactobacillus acidipiscis]